MSNSNDSTRPDSASCPADPVPHKNTSFSSGDQFNRCERQFYYERVRKLDTERGSIPLSIGNIYHEGLDVLCRHTRAGGEVCPDIVRQCVDRGLKKAQSDRMWQKPRMLEKLLKHCADNLEWVGTKLLPGLKIIEVERWFRDKPGFIAKLDLYCANTPIEVSHGEFRFLDEPCILDWKTVMETSRRNDYKVKNDGQLAKYCWLRDVRRGVVCEMHKRGPVAHPITFYNAEFTAEEIERWGRYWQTLDQTIRARDIHNEDEWKLSHPSNGLCCEKWCPFWDRCPGGAGGAS